MNDEARKHRSKKPLLELVISVASRMLRQTFGDDTELIMVIRPSDGDETFVASSLSPVETMKTLKGYIRASEADGIMNVTDTPEENNREYH